MFENSAVKPEIFSNLLTYVTMSLYVYTHKTTL